MICSRVDNYAVIIGGFGADFPQPVSRRSPRRDGRDIQLFICRIVSAGHASLSRRSEHWMCPPSPGELLHLFLFVHTS